MFQSLELAKIHTVGNSTRQTHFCHKEKKGKCIENILLKYQYIHQPIKINGPWQTLYVMLNCCMQYLYLKSDLMVRIPAILLPIHLLNAPGEVANDGASTSLQAIYLVSDSKEDVEVLPQGMWEEGEANGKVPGSGDQLSGQYGILAESPSEFSFEEQNILSGSCFCQPRAFQMSLTFRWSQVCNS